jgi:hypothetical protein
MDEWGLHRVQVLIRLGYWHVWTTLGRPQSLHFYLDLTDQEQKDVAKDVVKLGCKASISAKAAAKAQGITQVSVISKSTHAVCR